MRKTILLLLSLLAAIIPATGQATDSGETESQEAAIDKSSVVFDYKRHSTFGFMGDLTFRVKIPLNTKSVTIFRSLPQDRSLIVKDKFIYPITHEFRPDPDVTDWEIALHNVTWGTTLTFSCYYDEYETGYASNTIYTDDYMRPEDLELIKPGAGIDITGNGDADIIVTEANLNISTHSGARIQIYNLHGRELFSYCKGSGDLSIPMDTLPRGILIVRVISAEKTTVKRIIH